MSMIGQMVQVPPEELENLAGDADAINDLLMGGGGYSLEKMWQALHVMLTGDPEMGGDPPLAWAILGNEEIGEDLGYGPARFLTPDEVQEVAAALAGVTHEDMKEGFDPKELEESDLYPDIADEDPDELFDELMIYFDGLVEYYSAAAESGNGMLLAIT